MQCVGGKTLEEWEMSLPLIARIRKAQEVFWWNRNTAAFEDVLPSLDICRDDIVSAAARLKRFAPLISRLFPQTASAGGIIESNVIDIPLMRKALCSDPSVCGVAGENPNGDMVSACRYPSAPIAGVVSNGVCDTPNGRLMLKCDYDLPVSGSIKARGGIYEVLKHAEGIALKHGLLKAPQYHGAEETVANEYRSSGETSPYTIEKHKAAAEHLSRCDYRVLASADAREIFGRYSIAVGSTGNLGLSIGIMGSALGFRVTVHMSADARQWKKDLLRAKGVTVIEYEADYGKAVEQGRKEAEADPTCHFVDDENSRDLFMGYAVAGERLKEQLTAMRVTVDADHPLFVYLPCGVGGGPGGVAFGLKCAFGDNVHCFFAEPTHSPAMLLGLYTGLHDAVSAQDFGLDNKTAADGLAVGRPSGFVGTRMERLIDGVFTVSDHTMHRQLAQLADAHGIYMEPSALAGMSGMLLTTAAHDYLRHHGLALSVKHATHLVWGTGGSMVPQMDMQRYYAMGKALL